jgi:hypothetical protein
MTLVISKGITLRKGYIGTDDPDAEAYIAAVEAADEAESPGVGALETATKVAIHTFVKGCKADGIWPAIKASCILAGARTRLGSLTPLTGPTPTSFNFVDADYNRKTGLVGDGSTKYLTSGTVPNFNAADCHGAVYRSTAEGYNQQVFSNNTTNVASLRIKTTATARRYRGHGTNLDVTDASIANGFAAVAVLPNLDRQARHAATTTTFGAGVAVSAGAGSFWLFSAAGGGSPFSTARLAFYSFGTSTNLTLLDTRVTDLINAFGAAIP